MCDLDEVDSAAELLCTAARVSRSRPNVASKAAAEEEGIYKVPGAAAKRMQQLGDSIIKLQKAREEAAAAARRESSASPLRNTILFRNQSKRPRPLGDEGGSGKDVTFAVQV